MRLRFILKMPYQCNRCDKKFKSEFSWKRHQENDAVHERLENYTPYHECEICGKRFDRKRKWCLDQHMLTHNSERNYSCQNCGNSFKSANYLAIHSKSCLGIKEHECAYCGLKFGKKAVLNNHERLHTGDKPFQCRICDTHFRTHHLYSQHGNSAHGATSTKHFNELQNMTLEVKKE